jgi:hypothetical protein
VRLLASQSIAVSLLLTVATPATGQTPGPVYPALVRPAIQTGTESQPAPRSSFTPAARPQGGTCALAEVIFGVGGLVLGAAGTDFVTGHSGLAGPALVAGGVGTTGGIMLGAYAGGCHASVWGAAGGAAVGVAVGATWGKAFAADRTEAEATNLGASYLIMLTLALLGAQL